MGVPCAVGPVLWMAPETLWNVDTAAPPAVARIATPASDVFMFGGLVFELVTARAPYYWLLTPGGGATDLLVKRLHSKGPFRVAGIREDVVGLRGVPVVDASTADGVSLPVAIARSETPGWAGRIDVLMQLSRRCHAEASADRPTLSVIQTELQAMLDAERDEARVVKHAVRVCECGYTGRKGVDVCLCV